MRTSIVAVLWSLLAVYQAARADDTKTLDRVESHGTFTCGPGEVAVPISTSVAGAERSGWTCVSNGMELLDRFRGDDRFDGGYNSRLFEETRDSVTQESTMQVCRTNPIDIASGKKIETDTDFSAGGEFPLELVRTHRSLQWAQTSIFGLRWATNFAYSLHFEGDYFANRPDCDAIPGYAECSDTSGYPDFRVYRPDGTNVTYTKDANGVFWEQKAAPVSKATREADGTWTVYEADRTIKRYTKGGYLKEWKNQQGVGWTFAYGGKNGTQLQTITHTTGRTMQFFWTGDALVQVKDPAGNAYDYTYIDGGTNMYGKTLILKSVKYPGTPATTLTYHYTNEGSSTNSTMLFGLTGKSYNGIRFSTYGYSSTDNKATSSEHAGGVERSSFVYTTTANGRSVVETNPLGLQTTFRFSSKGDLLSVEGAQSTNCAATTKGATYAYNGYLDAETDFNNNVTDYEYAANGQLQTKIEALGTSAQRTTSYAWDPADNRLLTETVLGDHETSYEYGTDQRLSKISIKNISTAVPASQNRVRATTFSYTHHPNGLIATIAVDGPLPSDTITSTYNAFGDLIQVQNGLGHITSSGGHDAMGRLGYTISPNGSRTDYTYDARGRLLTSSRVVNGATQTTTSTYDGFGRLAKITLPDGQYRAFQYDIAGRVRYEWEPEQGGTFAEKVFTYNAMSLPTSIKVRRISVEPTQGTVQ